MDNEAKDNPPAEDTPKPVELMIEPAEPIPAWKVRQRETEYAIKHRTKHPLCIVCKGPSAMFRDGSRLSKSMIRITEKTMANTGVTRTERRTLKDVSYVHTAPCLRELVNNWAKYIIETQGLAGLEERVKLAEKSSDA